MSSQPGTLVELFKNAVNSRPVSDVFRYKQDKAWTGLTGARLLDRVRNLTLALHRRGVAKGDAVAILAESGPLWSIADYAILSAGAVNVPIYPTQSVNQAEYILRESEPKLLFISTARQARRIGEALKRLPELPIVSFQPIPEIENAVTIDVLEGEGEIIAREQPDLYESISAEVTPEQTASIIYTSGTTGEPKGVILSHSNIVFNALASGTHLSIEPENIMLSFLPLSHIFERMVLYLCLHHGVQICYAGGIETVAADLREVRPTLMSTVPRLLEKIFARMQKTAAEGGLAKQRIFEWSLTVARRVAERKSQGRRIPAGLWLQRAAADRLVYSKLREAIGGRMMRLVSGGSALPVDIALVFNGAGIPVLQGYGLTETSPVIAVSTLDHNRIGTVGRPLPGLEIKIADDGEILTRGPHVFQGYYKKDLETQQVFVDGKPGESRWFMTGDIGLIDAEGFLRITDRKKDLIKTSAGKYVAPQLIEGALSQSEFIEQSLIIGNNRKYVSALIVPDFERLREWARRQDIGNNDKQELIEHPKIVEMMKQEVGRLTRGLADYEKVKRIALLPEEFTIDGGELTPTLKVRRKIVEQKYQTLIDSLYPAGAE